jgi:hypothetical protein
MSDPFLPLRLQEAARLAAEWPGVDAAFLTTVGTDSRRLPGCAVRGADGPNFDGHDLSPPLARERGAARRWSAGRWLIRCRNCESRIPGWRWADWRRAWRSRFTGPLIALTGSNGKTTLKEMIAAILRRRGPVLATEGNLNNDIGVPLTLLRLRAEHAYAVIEMGANHPGEIAYLTGFGATRCGDHQQCRSLSSGRLRRCGRRSAGQGRDFSRTGLDRRRDHQPRRSVMPILGGSESGPADRRFRPGSAGGGQRQDAGPGE